MIDPESSPQSTWKPHYAGHWNCSKGFGKTKYRDGYWENYKILMGVTVTCDFKFLLCHAEE